MDIYIWIYIYIYKYIHTYIYIICEVAGAEGGPGAEGELYTAPPLLVCVSSMRTLDV